jgi:NADP-dependent 3-hydroxy acid dehydrogenase YdfG
MQDMTRWKGRTAIVTGASSGIGRAVALNLSRHGMRVTVAARRADRLAELAGEIERAGGEVLAAPADMRDEGQILDLFGRTRARFGGVDVLVNNAGLGRKAPLLSSATEPWREMLEVNVLALCICTREAVKDMQARGAEGHVIHISSMAGHRIPPNSGVYAATKHGVRALTEALRMELHDAKSAVRVTSISPGYVETGFAAIFHGSEEVGRQTYQRLKVLQAEDIAEAVVYALSQPAHVQVHDILLRPREQAN